MSARSAIRLAMATGRELPETFAYLAGLVDGEGTITLARKHSNRNRVPELSISSTDPELLELPAKTFGGVIRAKRMTGNKAWSRGYEYRLKGMAAVRAMRAILPWLRCPEKIRRATLIIGQYEAVTLRNGRYSSAALERKLAFEDQFFGSASKLKRQAVNEACCSPGTG